MILLECITILCDKLLEKDDIIKYINTFLLTLLSKGGFKYSFDMLEY